jgi:hypothetical protein
MVGEAAVPAGGREWSFQVGHCSAMIGCIFVHFAATSVSYLLISTSNERHNTTQHGQKGRSSL